MTSSTEHERNYEALQDKNVNKVTPFISSRENRAFFGDVGLQYRKPWTINKVHDKYTCVNNMGVCNFWVSFYKVRNSQLSTCPQPETTLWIWSEYHRWKKRTSIVSVNVTNMPPESKSKHRKLSTAIAHCCIPLHLFIHRFSLSKPHNDIKVNGAPKFY